MLTFQKQKSNLLSRHQMNTVRSFVCIVYLVLVSNTAKSQFTNMNWAFGDSSGIHFSATGVDSTYRTAVNARGSCAAISNAAGQLLFYAASPDLELVQLATIIEEGRIYNKNHQMMEGGDSLACQGWYGEMMILPWPDSSHKFAVVHSMATSGARLSYSVVDLTYNNGLGKVVSKNNILAYGNICDGMTAIRHGNGRDWWILFRKWFATTNFFYKILLTPNGFSGITTQQIGKAVNASKYTLIPSEDGEMMVGIGAAGDSVVESFGFDRCTGQLSNHRIIYNGDISPAIYFWDGALSASGRYLYLSNDGNAPPSVLYQLDLHDSLSWDHRVVVDSTDTLELVGAALRLAPNGKIYRSDWWCKFLMICYPFEDTAISPVNTHLSVINTPDSGGLSCNYVGLGQYLGGYRTYLGLPKNINVTLGVKTGSACDTLTTAMGEEPETAPIYIYPNPARDRVQVSLPFRPPIEGVEYTLSDVCGRTVQQGKLHYITNEININQLPAGMYVVIVKAVNSVFQSRLIKY